MSRNMCRTTCPFCDSDVRLTGESRPASEFTHSIHAVGISVATAECTRCYAPYLAWTKDPMGGWLSTRRLEDGQSHFDLSHFHSFNDEPGRLDGPKSLWHRIYRRFRWPNENRPQP